MGERRARLRAKMGELVWTEQDRRDYLAVGKDLSSEMHLYGGIPLITMEPLLAIEVNTTTESMVEEEIPYKGILKRVLIEFLRGHIALVSVMPYLNEKPLLENALVGDEQLFVLKQDIEFEKGSVAKVVIKNFAQVGHTPRVRFFTEDFTFEVRK